MSYPTQRMRRLRTSPAMRRLVGETRLDAGHLIAGAFVVPGSGVRREIAALPGVDHVSTDQVVEDARRLADLGVGGLILIGLPETKNAQPTGPSIEIDIGGTPLAESPRRGDVLSDE